MPLSLGQLMLIVGIGISFLGLVLSIKVASTSYMLARRLAGRLAETRWRGFRQMCWTSASFLCICLALTGLLLFTFFG